MPATIFGERFLGVREPAWHELGQVVGVREVDAVQAVQRAGMDYQVTLQPLQVSLPGDAGNLAIENKFAVVREPTRDDAEYRVFGVVGRLYEPLQNVEIAEAIQPLVDKWPVETAGALGLGERIFLTLDAGTGEIGGEEVRQFFLVTEAKDGGTSVQVAFTPIRVVCANTLSVGLQEARMNLALDHERGVKSKLQGIATIMAQMEKSIHQTMNVLQNMARFVASQEQVQDLIHYAYTVGQHAPKRSARRPSVKQLLAAGGADEQRQDVQDALSSFSAYEKKVQRDGERRLAFAGAAQERLEVFNGEQPSLANTLWAAYNAVTETEDWRKGPRGDDGVAVQALFGERANTKRRAFDRAAEIMA